MIRQATIKDIYDLASLYQDANPSIATSEIQSWTKSGLNEFPEYNFIYEEKDEILGGISGIVENQDVGIINDVAVLRGKRGKGIGTKLVQHVLSSYNKNNIAHIRLCIFWRNAAIVPFYYMFGFKLCGTGEELGQDVIYMEKST